MVTADDRIARLEARVRALEVVLDGARRVREAAAMALDAIDARDHALARLEARLTELGRLLDAGACPPARLQ